MIPLFDAPYVHVNSIVKSQNTKHTIEGKGKRKELKVEKRKKKRMVPPRLTRRLRGHPTVWLTTEKAQK